MSSLQQIYRSALRAWSSLHDLTFQVWRQGWKKIPLAAQPFVMAAIVIAATLSIGICFRSELLVRADLPISYWARDSLNRNPSFHPHFKLFGVDDRLAEYLQSDQLSLSQWAALIKSIDQAAPRALVIDKMFYFSTRESQSQEAEQFIETLQTLKSPVFIGAAAFPQQLRAAQLALSRPEWNAQQFVGNEALPEWIPRVTSPFYGPSPDFESIPWEIGHINHLGMGRFSPLIQIQSDSSVPAVIPFLALMPFREQIRIRSDEVTINEKPIGIDDNKVMHANLASLKEYYLATRSLIGLVRRSEDGVAIPESEISSNDIVLIGPEFYTGAGDKVSTPRGIFPGTYLLAAVMNSALNQRWITPACSGLIAIWILVFTLFGHFLLSRIRGEWHLSISLLIAATASTVAILVFVFSDRLVSPSLTFVATALGCLSISQALALRSRQESLIDPLTGLFNRRFFDDVLIKEWNSILRFPERTKALVIFDIDNFKLINDRYGHAVGDQAIRYLAKTVQGQIRSNDTLARIGGEEFAIISDCSTVKDLLALCEKVRTTVASHPVEYGGGSIPMTVSMGACFLKSNIERLSPWDCFKIADQALYQAKNSGRNRAISADT